MELIASHLSSNERQLEHHYLCLRCLERRTVGEPNLHFVDLSIPPEPRKKRRMRVWSRDNWWWAPGSDPRSMKNL